jgi:hypothetical protein
MQRKAVPHYKSKAVPYCGTVELFNVGIGTHAAYTFPSDISFVFPLPNRNATLVQIIILIVSRPIVIMPMIIRACPKTRAHYWEKLFVGDATRSGGLKRN